MLLRGGLLASPSHLFSIFLSNWFLLCRPCCICCVRRRKVDNALLVRSPPWPIFPTPKQQQQRRCCKLHCHNAHNHNSWLGLGAEIGIAEHLSAYMSSWARRRGERGEKWSPCMHKARRWSKAENKRMESVPSSETENVGSRKEMMNFRSSDWGKAFPFNWVFKYWINHLSMGINSSHWC